MPESEGLIGIGTTLAYADTELGSYTDVAEVFDSPPPDEDTGEDIEMTHYTSPEQTKEYRAGWNEPGESVFQCNFVPSQYQTLRTLKRTTKWWRITYEDGSYDKFQGYIKRLSRAIPYKDRCTASITIKGAGVRRFVAAS